MANLSLQAPAWSLALGALALVLATALLQACSTGYKPLSVAVLTAGGPIATTQAQGLVMTLQVNPGPYFLGELVATQMTLTNTTAATYDLAGSPDATVCDPALQVVLSGGQLPTYTLPTTGFTSCALIDTTLMARKTWVSDALFPLTASGDVTLTARASFIESSIVGHTRYEHVTDSPFTAPPAISLSVAPTPPPTRVIALLPSHQSQSHQVTIDAPPAARWKLYSIYIATCNDPPGGAGDASFAWQPVAGDTLDEPRCPGRDEVWRYSVGAPGYEIASGVYSANGYDWRPTSDATFTVTAVRSRLRDAEMSA